MEYAYKEMKSPVGRLKLVARDNRLVAVLWENDKPFRVKLGDMIRDDANAVLVKAENQLNEYFAGKRQSFDLDLGFEGTEFQQKVWNALLTIPFGETRSYLDIAKQVGNAKATRAVGAANGRNPLSIIAPCHRVIGSTGKLTGFAGGLDVKEKLLALESGGKPPSGEAGGLL